MVQLNFRIEFELYTKLIEYAEKHQITRTQAVTEAIKKLLQD